MRQSRFLVIESVAKKGDPEVAFFSSHEAHEHLVAQQSPAFGKAD